MKKKWIAFGMVCATILSVNAPVFANREIDTEVLNEKWGKSTFVYGESLNQQQIEETRRLLNIKDPTNVNQIQVTYDDLLKYIGGDANNKASMVSSVLVQKENKNSGIDVTIKSPKNITQVTEKQYENAAITAGVSDATILVAAVRPVTGESALTGVYKAFEANGETLDKDRMKVAQDELELISKINQENKEKGNYNIENFNNIIIEIKNTLTNIHVENKNISLDQIREVIDEAVQKYQMQDVITSEQKDELTKLFEKYVNTSAIDSKEVQKQLKELSSDIVSKAQDIYQQAEETGLLEKIGQFFKSIFDGLLRLFRGE